MSLIGWTEDMGSGRYDKTGRLEALINVARSQAMGIVQI